MKKYIKYANRYLKTAKFLSHDATTHLLTISITINSMPAEDVKVNIINRILPSDTSGYVKINLIDGIYPYTISKSGYTTIKGSVTIANNDVNINVTLSQEVTSQYISSSNNIAVVELGQSNMEGRDGNNDVLGVGKGYYFNPLSLSNEHLTEDRGDAIGGSHATYFARYLYDNTNIAPILTESASGGSGLTATSEVALNNNWSNTGDLRLIAETNAENLITRNENITPIALWNQGERDANFFDDNSTTYLKATIKSAMQDVIDWWLNLYPNSLFLISETGHKNTGDTAGYVLIREIQNEIVSENTNVHMAFTGAKDFLAAGKMLDTYHYTYLGYKDMGEAFASKIIELLEL